MVQIPANGIEHFLTNGARERYLSQEEAQRLMAELRGPIPTAGLQHHQAIVVHRCPQNGNHACSAGNRPDVEAPLADGASVENLARRGTSSLSDAALDVLAVLPRELKSPCFFWNPNTGRPQDSISSWPGTPSGSAAGIPDDTAARPAFIPSRSFLVTRGGPILRYKKLLGPLPTRRTTQRYAHLAPGALIEGGQHSRRSGAGQSRAWRRSEAAASPARASESKPKPNRSRLPCTTRTINTVFRIRYKTRLGVDPGPSNRRSGRIFTTRSPIRSFQFKFVAASSRRSNTRSSCPGIVRLQCANHMSIKSWAGPAGKSTRCHVDHLPVRRRLCFAFDVSNERPSSHLPLAAPVPSSSPEPNPLCAPFPERFAE